MTPAILRNYQDSDRDAARALFLELNRYEFAITGDRRVDQGGAQVCVDDMIETVRHGGAAMVAEVDGAVVGLMVWSVKSSDPYVIEDVRKYGFVEDIIVSAGHRGLGIGRALLVEAERLTRQSGMTSLRLTALAGNKDAVAAYRRGGFDDYATVMIKTIK